MTCKLCKRQDLTSLSSLDYVCERCMAFHTILLDYQQYIGALLLQMHKELPAEFAALESRHAFVIETALVFLLKRGKKG